MEVVLWQQRIVLVIQAACADAVDIEKKLGSKSWRGSGGTVISHGVTWDIHINVNFYKNGSYYTGNDTVKYNTDHAYVATKYVSGSRESDFGVHGYFSVYDDNNVQIHEKNLYSGNPFK